MRIPTPSLLATAVLGGLLLSSMASAESGDDMFKKMDANGDGRISAQEHDAGAKAMFDKMDANHDGTLAAGEMMSMHQGMGDRHRGMMLRADGNHDGVITAAEHAAAAKAMFDRMDTNQDGRVAGAELMAGHHAMRDHDHKDEDTKPAGHDMKHQDMKGGHAMHGDDKAGHRDGAKGMRHGPMMAMMDANHDGKVTAAEHAAGAKAMFLQIDANHDGLVSRAEFDAGMKAMHDKP